MPPQFCAAGRVDSTILCDGSGLLESQQLIGVLRSSVGRPLARYRPGSQTQNQMEAQLSPLFGRLLGSQGQALLRKSTDALKNLWAKNRTALLVAGAVGVGAAYYNSSKKEDRSARPAVRRSPAPLFFSRFAVFSWCHIVKPRSFCEKRRPGRYFLLAVVAFELRAVGR